MEIFAPPGVSVIPDTAGPIAASTLGSLFWQHVVREWLTGLPLLAESHPEIFDGRMSLILRGGLRVPIKSVHPLFGCSVRQGGAPRSLSEAVQCSVFVVETPTGEAFTFPVHEVRTIHTLSEELLSQLDEIVNRTAGKGDGLPFGFAAYAALAREERETPRTPPGPPEPADRG